MRESTGECSFCYTWKDANKHYYYPTEWSGLCKKIQNFEYRNGKGPEQVVWECPHDSLPGENQCIFHTIPEEVPDYADERKAFIEACKKSSRKGESSSILRQFIGAKFDRLDISWSEMPKFKYTDMPIVFVGAQFNREFEIGSVNCSIRAEGATFKGESIFHSILGDLNLKNSKIEKMCSLRHANIEGKCSFRLADVSSYVDIGPFNISGQLDMGAAEFGDRINLQSSNIGGDFTLSSSTIKGGIHCPGATFKANADFSEAIIHGSAYFTGTSFLGEANFEHTEFYGETSFTSREGTQTVFRKHATFSKSKFLEKVSFSGEETAEGIFMTEFGFPPDFSQSNLVGADFEITELSGANFARADLTDASLSRANLQGAIFERTILSRADFFSTDLSEAALYGSIAGDARINTDTRLLIPANKWWTAGLCVYEPKYEQEFEATSKDISIVDQLSRAASMYRIIEQIGRSNARTRLQIEAFVRRKDAQRKIHLHQTLDSGNDSWQRVIGGFKFVFASVSWAIMRYGESPWRLTFWAFLVIIGFGLFYPLGGWIQPTPAPLSNGEFSHPGPIRYGSESLISTLEQSIYYSVLTFTALGFGDFRPIGIGRTLTLVETGLGTILISLLIFVLGRRAAR